MRLDERGFALPTTIFLVALLTVMLAAAMARAATDHEIAAGAEQSVTASSVAQSGIHRYVSLQTTRPQPGVPDTLSLGAGIVGGYAVITPWVIQKPADTLENEYFVLESVGHAIEATSGPEPLARRTIGQIAYWQTGHVNEMASVIAFNGTTAAAPAFINGSDGCTSQTVPGVRLPSSVTAPNPSYISGSPDVVQSGTVAFLDYLLGIDWSTVQSGSFNYDATSNPIGFSNQVWFIDGDLNTGFLLGSGVLVVTGSADISFGWWYGVVIVGEELTLGALANLNGIVITGLDRTTGGTAANNDIRGNIRYNSCYVSTAMSNFTGLVLVDNAWMDNWATY